MKGWIEVENVQSGLPPIAIRHEDIVVIAPSADAGVLHTAVLMRGGGVARTTMSPNQIRELMTADLIAGPQ